MAREPVGTALETALVGAATCVEVLPAYGLMVSWLAWRKGFYANPWRAAFLGPVSGEPLYILMDIAARILALAFSYTYSIVELFWYDKLGLATSLGRAVLLALLAVALIHGLAIIVRDVKRLASLLKRCEDQRYETYEEQWGRQTRTPSSQRDRY